MCFFGIDGDVGVCIHPLDVVFALVVTLLFDVTHASMLMLLMGSMGGGSTIFTYHNYAYTFYTPKGSVLRLVDMMFRYSERDVSPCLCIRQVKR